MQVKSKTFVVYLLIQAISLVCSLKLIGIKLSITAIAFQPFYVITSCIKTFTRNC